MSAQGEPDRDTVLATLREHEPELREAGVVSLSVFGSVARGQAEAGSDVDVVVRLDESTAQAGFAYFGRLDGLANRLREILGRPVDIVFEPIRKDRLRETIEKEGAVAF